MYFATMSVVQRVKTVCAYSTCAGQQIVPILLSLCIHLQYGNSDSCNSALNVWHSETSLWATIMGAAAGTL
jgi:hypothetical protein